MTTVVTSAFDKAAYSAYEFVRAERDALKEAENVYKRRIEALEIESKETLRSYQAMYKENKVLRSKLEHGPDANRIRRFRADLKRYEEKSSHLATERELLTKEVHALQREKELLNLDTKRVNAAFETERGLHIEKARLLEQEAKDQEKKLEELEKAKAEYEFRLTNQEKEASIYISQMKDVKMENLKLEGKFKKQMHLAEDEIESKTSELNVLKSDLAAYKDKHAKVNAEYNSLKSENEELRRKNIFLTKELDVYKFQTEKLKKDVSTKKGDYEKLHEEAKDLERMLADAREDGFEAVLDERQTLRRKEKKYKGRVEQLEEHIGELSRANRDLEKQNGELRAKYEAASLDKETLMFSEEASKRRQKLLEQELLDIEVKDPTKLLLSRNKKGVVVTMTDRKIEHIQKEKSTLVARIQFLEKENRKAERRIRQLESHPQSGALQDYEENWTMVVSQRRMESAGGYSHRRNRRDRMSHRSSQSLDDAFKKRLSPLTLPLL